MVCPHCGLYMSSPSIKACLRCGQPLSSSTSSVFSEPAKPARGSGRSKRKLLSVSIIIIVLAACAAYGYLVFGASGHPASGNQTIPGTTQILFSDPLTTNTNGWSYDGSHCFFQDNAYHVKNNIVCYSSAGSVGDASISVQTKQVAGSLLLPYGLVFRRIGRGNWYEFDIDSNGNWDFVKVVNQKDTVLVHSTPNAAIKKGLNTTNTLLVQAKGSHFTFFVNGTQVGQADDTTFKNGETGLTATGADTEVAFNNFQIMAAS